MHTKLQYFILAALYIVSSCENQSSIHEAEELIVLEGYLFQNEQINQIYLGKTLDFLSEDTIFPIVKDAEVFLYWNDNEYLLTHYENGFYEYKGDDLQIIEGNPEDIEIGLAPPRSKMNFRFLSQPFKTDTYILRIFLSIQQYGRHAVKVYRVNQEYADLYESREQDSRSLAEPLTNVGNGLGIFTAFNYEEVMINIVKQ